MAHMRTLAAVSTLALTLAAPAMAQTLISDTEFDDRISDIEIEAERNIARSTDSARYTFGTGERSTSGSVALTYSGATGNTDTQDFAAGGRYNMRFGDWNHSLGFALAFGESNGVKDEENALMIYDVTRSFSDRFYAFGLARLEVDNFASLRRDAFVGVGPGYRVINTDDMAWRVQAGVGARYTEVVMGVPGARFAVDDTETAGIISSRFFYRINPTVTLTNDTDILGSDTNTSVTNDLGVNVAMSNALSTRIGYRTEYDSDPQPGFEHTDNTLNLSLIYSFN